METGDAALEDVAIGPTLVRLALGTGPGPVWKSLGLIDIEAAVVVAPAYVPGLVMPVVADRGVV